MSTNLTETQKFEIWFAEEAAGSEKGKLTDLKFALTGIEGTTAEEVCFELNQCLNAEDIENPKFFQVPS